MKTIIRPLLMLLILTTAVSCDLFRKVTNTDQQTAQGKPYELIVACSQELWTGMVGDSLRVLLTAPVPYLNQTEPLFDVQRVTERGLTGLIAAHRNVLKVLVDSSLKEASTVVQYDVTAQPQIMMTLQGPTPMSLVDYLSAHGPKIVEALEQAERERAIKQNATYNNSGIGAAILKNFGVKMNVPVGYTLANEQPDFLWARYEFPAASQGFFVYSYPYAGPESLKPEALIAARNQFAARIPGPSQGSYMTTTEVIKPEYKTVRLDGRLWCEMRGFWDVAGDFMGGPYVSYTTVDQATNRVFTLDCYIFSPKLHKRNFMRGVEHLIYGVSIPAAPSK